MMQATGSRNRCRTSGCLTCCAGRRSFFIGVFTLMAFCRSVSGLALSRAQVSEGARSREIALPDEISRRCDPVPLHVLWLRLNIAPNLPSSVQSAPDSEPQNVVDLRTSSSNDAALRVEPIPEPGIDSRFQDGGGFRSRRDVNEIDAPTQPKVNKDSEDTNSGVARQPEIVVNSTAEDGSARHRRRRRHGGRRKEQEQHKRRHSRRKRKQSLRLLEQLSDGEAWQCQLTTRWQRMPDDVFPPYVLTGSCAQSRCMMGLYECRPRKYIIRILRRLSGRCNPLPFVGDAAVSAGFEESWMAEEYSVVVGCECSRRRASGRYDHQSS